MTRPDYVSCALTGLTGDATAWCGRKPVGFAFTDASHALLNAHAGGRLLLCPECFKAIRATLEAGTWGGDDE